MKKLLFIALALLLVSCRTRDVKPQIAIVDDVKLTAKAERIEQSTAKIDEVAKAPAVQAETQKINVVAQELRVDDATVQEYKKQIASLESQIKQLKSESEKTYQNVLAWGIRIGGLLIIGGIIASVLSLKLPFIGGMGILTLGIGFALTSTCYAMASRSESVIYVGVFLMLILIGAGFYFAYKTLKDDKNDKLAQLDLIKSIEILKDEVPNWEQVKKTISQIQHPSTQLVVKKLKETQVNNRI